MKGYSVTSGNWTRQPGTGSAIGPSRLCDEGLIPKDPGVRLSDLAGFRSVLVHLYCRLNLDEVYGVLQDDLSVVNRYRDLVRGMLRDNRLPE